MQMKYILLLSISVLLITSCKDEPDSSTETRKHQDNSVNTSTGEDPTISTIFGENTFEFGSEVELLKELHICDGKSTDDSNPKHPSCSPKFFRFFKLTEVKPLKEGFILLIKAGVNDFPIRRTLIFEREKGALVKLNGFNGNLIERRKTASGYDDLVIRFPDNINDNLTYYNCVFTWKDGKYEYVNCEVIDEDVPRRIKAEFMDSMALEIKKILDRNNMIF